MYIIVLAVSIVSLEVGAYAILASLKLSGKQFSEIYDPTGNAARFRGECDDYVQTLELHPYLAFVHNKQCSGSYRVNNIGLLNQEVDLTTKDFYSIGIYGGSVAAQFGGLAQPPQLEEILNGCYRNGKGKPFKVLNFADGAWKQPQQVIALVLYGDYIDLAISIEGFNEHYVIGSGLDISVPASSYASIINNDIFANSYFKLSHINGTALGTSNFVKLATVAYRKALEGRGKKYTGLIEQNFVLPQDVDRSTHNSKRYLGFVKAFDAIAESKGIYSLVVLQPSPLHKKLSASEKEKVGPLDYEKQYQEVFHILSNAKHFLNLADLFNDSDQNIFADHIHFVRDGRYVSYGNYRMALEIINKLSSDRQIVPKDNVAACVSKSIPTL
jgi:hypothetical protein